MERRGAVPPPNATLKVGVFLPRRNYYERGLLEKTPGKRYVYHFCCDLAGMLKLKPEEIKAAAKQI